MKTSGAKAKGRRLQDKVVLKLRELYKEILHREDIKPQPMGQNGADVIFSPSAKNLVAFDIECKNQEALVGAVLTNAIEQCEGNTEEGRIPLLIFKKNGEPERVILRLDHFLELIYPNGDVTFGADERKRLLIELERLKQTLTKGLSDESPQVAQDEETPPSCNTSRKEVSSPKSR